MKNKMLFKVKVTTNASPKAEPEYIWVVADGFGDAETKAIEAISVDHSVSEMKLVSEECYV